MNPEKKEKKQGEQTPDLTPEEMEEGDIGGSSSESDDDQESEKGVDTEGEEGGGGYGHPRTPNEDERPPA